MLFRKTHGPVFTLESGKICGNRIKMMIIFFIFYLFFAVIFPAASQESEATAEPAATEEPVATQEPADEEKSAGDWFDNLPLTDINFKGIVNAMISDIKPVIKEYIDKPFFRSTYYEIEDRLWDLGFFDDISGDILSANDGKTAVIIEFTVKEKPVISDIQINGNSLISDGDLFGQMKIKVGKFENKGLVYEDSQILKQYYVDHGFYEVTVAYRIEPDENGDKVIVYFDIKEGYKTTIKEILFSGNDFASSSTLLGKLESKKQEIFNHGYYVESNIELDKEHILTYYRQNGFIDVKLEKVDKAIEYDETKGRSFITLTFYIIEGNQYTFGGVTFEGNKVLSTEELMKLIKLKPGKIFNKEKWDSDLQSVISAYANDGYIHNMIIDAEERDDVNKVITYHIKIEERDRAHIENIIIVGNVKTKKYVILRELPFEVGDVFSAERIRSGLYNLYNLQYFIDIKPQPVQGSAEGLMDLVITVEESLWADLKFGVAFSGGNFPISGQFGWSDKNFLGTGRTLGIDTEFSVARQGFTFTYNDNYLFGKGWGGGISLSYYHNYFEDALQDIMAPIFTDEDVPDPFTSYEEYEDAVESGIDPSKYITMNYDSHDIQLAFSTNVYTATLLGKFGVSTSLSTQASYVWYDSSKYRHYNETVRDNLDTWQIINTWGTTGYWDTRDIYYNPESGYILSQYVGLSGGFLFGARDYIKLRTRAEAFISTPKYPIGDDFDLQAVLALHSAIAFLFPQFDGTLLATEKEKLYIDGMNTARGWDPVWNGESLFEFSAEIRHPIMRNILWWTWFFDAAAMYTERDGIAEMTLNDFYFSFGAGIRLTMPGLPIRLYFAQRFRNTDGQWELFDGEIPFIPPLSLRFVISVTQPGGF